MAMPRPSGKASKIAFDLIGVPANLRTTRSNKKKSKLQELLRQQDNMRIR